MTSQHNTGTHPFYIGMYIHICTHIYVHIYTSQKECGTRSLLWRKVSLMAGRWLAGLKQHRCGRSMANFKGPKNHFGFFSQRPFRIFFKTENGYR